jgi:DNA-binding NtrC family response regulator
MNTILLASKRHQVITSLTGFLRDTFELNKVVSVKECLNVLKERRHDTCLFDLDLIAKPGHSNNLSENIKSLQKVIDSAADIPLVVLADANQLRLAVQAVKAGAADYLCHPIERQEIDLVMHTLAEKLNIRSELDYLRSHFWKAEAEDLVRTRSPEMRALYESVEAVAPTKANILIHGDTGTGKSLLAKLIHLHSNRADDAFVLVHCGSIPDTLVESELFGHEKGSFTGAERRKLGRFQVADGGTIFLDEVGTITPNAQIKLLQVLQEGTFNRVGGEQEISVDVRVIAASNEDLQKKSENGQFRRDLYYRLNVFPLNLPDLKDRREDIPHLVDHFLRKLNQKYGKNIKRVSPDVLNALQGYIWPGNIRELENLMERAYILEKGPCLSSISFPTDIMVIAPSDASSRRETGDVGLAEVRSRAVREVEYRYLVNILERNKGRIEVCARYAGVTTRQFHNLLNKYNLKSKDFR